MDHLKVFISSTQTDLTVERDTAQAIVESLGHLCLRAETFDSPGKSPQEVCQEMARECDVYLGIFGKRYGFEVPDLGISATEMEYREARKQNPEKILIYVKDADDPEPEQARFLSEVQDFSAGYFRHERFATPDNLAEQIRRDLITWTTRRIRLLMKKEVEVQALREKVAHLSRVMDLFDIPKELR